jgi:hypothetical protein
MSKLGTFGAGCVLAVALSVGPSAGAAVHDDLLARLAPPALDAHGTVALDAEAAGLVERWAPVFVQHVSTEHPERDRPLPIDFDGNWKATDNWSHLTPAARTQKAAVYASAILTSTHAYLTYTLFFPRDWQPFFCVPYACHDNDLEVLLLVVERGKNGDADRLVLVETKAHHDYVPLRGAEVARAADHRPIIEVESQGHGMYALRRGDAPDGPYRLFVPAAAPTALEPAAAAPPDRYELLSLHATLWQRRDPDAQHGTLWRTGPADSLTYAGTREGRCGHPLGVWMAGQEYPGGVRPPWGLQAEGARGDWFLDPVLSVLRRYRSWFPAGKPIDTSYVLNPYLDDLKGECSGRGCPPAPSAPASVAASLLPLGVLLALGLAARRFRRRDA